MAGGDEEKKEQPSEIEVVEQKAENECPPPDKPQETGAPVRGGKQEKAYKKPSEGAEGADGANGADGADGGDGNALEVTEPPKDPEVS